MSIKKNYKEASEAISPWLSTIKVLGELLLVVLTFGKYKMDRETKTMITIEETLNWSEREAIGDKLTDIADSSYSEELKALMSAALEARLIVLNNEIK